MTHTKGLWSVELDQATDDFVVNKEAFEVCRIESCKDLHTAQQNRYNAHLIAAAPELLEALHAVRNKCTLYRIDAEGYAFDVINQIDNAIAKAEGKGRQ